MKLLITGICGFAGKSLALEIQRQTEAVEIFGLDNLSRPGSESNRQGLQRAGIRFFHGDVRNPSDIETLPKADWVIDASANPSVLAGISGTTSSRQLIETNLLGTTCLLEYCKRHGAGFLLLSTSRVYSAGRLSKLPVVVQNNAFAPAFSSQPVDGLSPEGVSETFSTEPPLSLYGAAKLASEILAFEYGCAFGLPVVVNRCGILAGAGQFGKPDQGIFSFWIHSYKQRRPLRYTGFGGKGFQVRDCLHLRDLAALVLMQVRRGPAAAAPLNVSGGIASAISLAQLSEWCAARFGRHDLTAEAATRPYDVPWLVLDSTRAAELWGWKPAVKTEAVLDEIASHAEDHPEWLDLSGGT